MGAYVVALSPSDDRLLHSMQHTFFVVCRLLVHTFRFAKGWPGLSITVAF
jgi:hypothetical protein